MHTTPNLGLSIPDTDNDAFDELVYLTAFNRLDGLVWTKIGNVTLNGLAGAINFNPLPTTFAHLKLVCVFRTDRPATNIDVMGLRFNGDASNSYLSQHGYGNGAVAGAQESAPQPSSFGQVCFCPAATAAAAHFASCEITIPYYFQTGDRFPVHSIWFAALTAAAGGCYAGTSGFDYETNTGPLASLSLLSTSGANLIAGSRATLYGLP